ncbi:hypothetical protein V7S43_001603 [Phytophthora oleae]|uniref:Secreted protein n=1 Tax=Phytophthora oleae TaxID=2107226 RepID=A0ABD3G7N4_9STRA
MLLFVLQFPRLWLVHCSHCARSRSWHAAMCGENAASLQGRAWRRNLLLGESPGESPHLFAGEDRLDFHAVNHSLNGTSAREFGHGGSSLEYGVHVLYQI